MLLGLDRRRVDRRIHEFLLFQKTYLFKDVGSDSINIFYPHVALLIDYVRRRMPSWSFRQGMGQNVFAGVGDRSAFHFYAFGGLNNIGFAIAYVEVVRRSC